MGPESVEGGTLAPRYSPGMKPHGSRSPGPNLDGCVVVITGASRGIGAATARAFRRRGARQVLLARGREDLDALVAELGDGNEILAEALDVTDFQGFVRVLETARQRFGGINVLINNAGYHPRGNLASVDPEDLARTVDVNLKAPVVLTRMALPLLAGSNPATVINVASLAGRTPVPGAAVYSGTKFGVRAFGLAQAEELRSTSVRVASVSPGPVDTGFIMDDLDAVSDLTFSQPLSTADQVAEAIVELLDSRKLDRPRPALSGLLTTISYLFPSVARGLRPLLERKGRRTRERLRARNRGRDG